MMALGSTCIWGVGTVWVAARSGTGRNPGVLLAPSQAPLQGDDAETPHFSAGDGSFGASVASFRAPPAWLDVVNFHFSCLGMSCELLRGWHGHVISFQPSAQAVCWVDFGSWQEEAQPHEVGPWCAPSCREPWSPLPGVFCWLFPFPLRVLVLVSS